MWVSDNLLHDASSNQETLIFCSQTLEAKVLVYQAPFFSHIIVHFACDGPVLRDFEESYKLLSVHGIR
ncbi:Transportin MOS14 [Camellia lanceoleosa]|uniref:Transportin MOS14 n=1 Tax=Camellia lanceoleosa TaxID=1840588 RepID=A0ACC0IB51_9ERIC|nr:Transportin MOS14 [Camellia lanceoleosa]